MNVTGPLAFGGIAGENFGDITDVVAGASGGSYDIVSDSPGSEARQIGGIVGSNTGDLSVAQNQAAAMTVTADAPLGSYAIGGIAGSNESGGTIADAITSMDITVTGGTTADAADIGGAVGLNAGSVARAAFTDTGGGEPQVDVALSGSGGEYTAGGFVGRNAGRIEDAYATGGATVVSGAKLSAVGGFAGAIETGSTIARSYASGPVSADFTGGGTGSTGGHTGASAGGSVSESYWDTLATGQAVSAGGTALTTADLQDTDAFLALAGASATNPDGWNFTSIWAPGAPGAYPAIFTIVPVVFADADDASAVYGASDGTVASGSTLGGRTCICSRTMRSTRPTFS